MSTSTLDIHYADHSMYPPAARGQSQENGDEERRKQARTIRRVLHSAERDTWVSLTNSGVFVAVLSDMLGQSANSVAVSLSPIGAELPEVAQPPLPAENAPVIALLRRWLADETGYDEKVWPEIEHHIEENRSSYRKRFDG